MKELISSLKSHVQDLKLNKTLLALAFSLILIATASFFTSGFSAKNLVIAASNSNGGGGGEGGTTEIDPNGAGSEGTGGGGSGSGTPLCGFAWGATNESPNPKMGVGWVSFNSKDCDTNGDNTISDAESAATPGCPVAGTSSYGVTVDSNRNLTGYAWSSNIGWIQFGGLSGMPNTSGNNQQDAKIDSNNSGSNNVSGWARAVAGVGRTDGWDGWISLKGNGFLSGSYGVTFDGTTHKFSGYSWGGPVVGWLRWDSSSSNGVRYCASTGTLAVTLAANPSTGTATIPSVVLTATPNPAGSPDSYRFKCDTSDLTMSAPQSSNTFTCTNYYSVQGRNYTPVVELTRGSLQATSTATVTTDPPPADLNVSCSVDPSPTVLINHPATWSATVNNPGTPPYRYTFNFFKNDAVTPDVVSPGQPNPVIISGSNNTTETVDRTYSTLGNKSVTVTVQDSATPVPATGQCPRVGTGVTVQTKIIEI